MTIATADYLDAALQLPPGGRLTLRDVAWSQYERLLEQLGDESHRRISYSDGRLEITSPSNKHEKLKNLINSLVDTTCYELGVDWLSLGSATLKKQPSGRGVEADDCFYFAKAASMIRQDTLDLASDPPPDIVVEIDLTSESTWKLEIYASFGVPEVWHYLEDHLEILELAGHQYKLAAASRFLPVLTAERIIQFVAECESAGHLQSQRKLHAWLKTVKASQG
ncbi:MAG TPA: Uma2 family endonuclease [Blastocatellia bacterium]|nr:Uma2 family endonuclease [Blastocatellia bacterium]